MSEFDCVCFDLDGTLCDSKPGILNGLNHAYKEMGEAIPSQEYFLQFIGLSLDKSLAKFTDFDEDKIETTIRVFREYYGEKGIFDGELYSGVPTLIKKIASAGIDMFLVTAKPQHFAEAILEHFNLKKYFKGVYGLNPDITYPGKTAHLNKVISNNKYSNLVMIGDRHMDIDAANETNSKSIAATFGYGSLEELQNASPSYFADNCSDIEKIIL